MPQFDKQFYTDTVPENIELHSPLSVSIQATSPMSRKLIYSIVKGNELEEFAVDFNTGMFRVFATSLHSIIKKRRSYQPIYISQHSHTLFIYFYFLLYTAVKWLEVSLWYCFWFALFFHSLDAFNPISLWLLCESAIGRNNKKKMTLSSISRHY